MSYEFNDKENKKIMKFTQRINLLSLSSLFFGSMSLVLGIIQPVNWGDIMIGLLFLTISFFLYLPINNFQAVIVTAGNDIKELIEGFKRFSDTLNIFIAVSVVLLLTIIINYIISI